MSGVEVAGRIESILGAYAPETNAVQLNLLDSHDTPRIRTLLGCDEAAVRMALLLQVALPGAPCIYYGDEIGLEGANDPDNRRGFPWDEATWDRPTLDFVRSLLTLRRVQPALREGAWRVAGTSGDSLAILRWGCWDASAAPTAGARPVLTVVNAGEGPVALTVSVPELAGQQLGPALASRDASDEPSLKDPRVGADGRLDLVFPARYGAILLPT